MKIEINNKYIIETSEIVSIVKSSDWIPGLSTFYHLTITYKSGLKDQLNFHTYHSDMDDAYDDIKKHLL